MKRFLPLLLIVPLLVVGFSFGYALGLLQGQRIVIKQEIQWCDDRLQKLDKKD